MILGSVAQGMEYVDSLPKGVRSIQLRYGNFDGLNGHFTDSGDLRSLTDIYSIELNSRTLTQMEPQARQLVNLLNQYGSYQLGDQLHLGRINVSVNPDVTYALPVILTGITDKWTVGLAIPIMTYSNQIEVSHTAGNLNQIRDHVNGALPEVDATLALLNTDYKQVFLQTLADKGYKPLVTKNDQFVGDIQIINIYRLIEKPSLQQTLRFYLSLPTGPVPDADDLTAIESLHQPALKTSWITEKPMAGGFRLLGAASYQLNFQRNRERRVPMNAEDLLPDASQKYQISEDPGDILSGTAGFIKDFGDYWSVAMGYQYEHKFKDQVAGAPAGRDQFLEKGSDRDAHLARIETTFSTIKSYQAGRSAIPWSIYYEWVSVFDGRNIEASVLHELGLSLFF